MLFGGWYREVIEEYGSVEAFHEAMARMPKEEIPPMSGAIIMAKYGDNNKSQFYVDYQKPDGSIWGRWVSGAYDGATVQWKLGEYLQLGLLSNERSYVIKRKESPSVEPPKPHISDII